MHIRAQALACGVASPEDSPRLRVRRMFQRHVAVHFLSDLNKSNEVLEYASFLLNLHAKERVRRLFGFVIGIWDDHVISARWCSV